MDKPLVCGKTAKSYKFWDNLIYHYENLKLHNKVCKFEQAVATEIEKRVNLDNPDWVHPTTRNDARYEEDEEGQQPAPGVKKSRFLRRERKVELSYKNQEQTKKELKQKVEIKKQEIFVEEKPKKETKKDRHG